MSMYLQDLHDPGDTTSHTVLAAFHPLVITDVEQDSFFVVRCSNEHRDLESGK